MLLNLLCLSFGCHTALFAVQHIRGGAARAQDYTSSFIFSLSLPPIFHISFTAFFLHFNTSSLQPKKNKNQNNFNNFTIVNKKENKYQNNSLKTSSQCALSPASFPPLFFSLPKITNKKPLVFSCIFIPPFSEELLLSFIVSNT